MTSREITTIVVRILAIWLFFRLLQVAGALIELPGRAASPVLVAAMVLASAIVAFVAVILLWVNATRVAGLLLPRDTSEEVRTHMSAQEIKQTAFSIVGLWLFASGVPRLAYWAAFIQRSAKVNPDGFNPSIEMYAGAASAVVQVIVGAILLLGSRGLVAMVGQLRGMRSREAEEGREQ